MPRSHQPTTQGNNPQETASPEQALDAMIGQAPPMQALRAQILRLSVFDTVGNPHVPTLLLQGETGTGKGLLAHVIHRSGPRRDGPFTNINCAAIPETLLEAELFGFEAGAFTDAKRAKPGLFETASGGTLFLDEIDSLSLLLQAKLLKAIEEKHVRRLGAVADQQIDVKLIAATKADLSQCVTQRQFRDDLYQRLAVVVLSIPPLHQRGDDIVALAQHFLCQYAEVHGVRSKRCLADAELWLRQYSWPGNVRELSHLMERVILLDAKDMIDAATLEQFCLPPRAALPSTPRLDLQPTLVADERTEMCQALRRMGGNVSRAAGQLGLSRSALRYRMQRDGITRQDWEEPAPVPGSITTSSGPWQTRVSATALADASVLASAACISTICEQKSTAVLALTMNWPTERAALANQSPLRTSARHWEQLLRQKVQGFGGLIIQYTPSFCVIAFGVPLALERMVQRAVQAALAIRQLATATDAEAEPTMRPLVRLAVHMGAVMVDYGASNPSAELFAVGETFEKPLRLLGHTQSGDILVSLEVARRVEEICELHPRQLQLDTGTSECVDAYLAVRLRRRHAPWARQVGYPLSPFVGRERELATLHERLARVEAGRGEVIGILGEAGIGKSRFLYEFRRSLLNRCLTYLSGSCYAYGTTTPYLPVLEVLRHNCGILDTDSPDTVATKVTRSLQEVGVDAETWSPYLSHFLGLSSEAGTNLSATLSPQAFKVRIFEALLQMSIKGSQKRPIVFEIEDFHWIDASSEEFLASLVERLVDVPILLLVTYRPERRPAWMDKSYTTQLGLTPLVPPDSHRIMASLLPRDHIPEALAQSILEKAEGNPFFLEELSRTVIEHGGLTPLIVPDTIQAVLAARIDRLAPEAKHLLQVAAVIGKNISYELLNTVAESSEKEVTGLLQDLQSAQFLHEAQLYPERSYTFKHVLTQEVAYQSLADNTRQQYHLRLAQLLTERVSDSTAPQSERVAYHFTEAGHFDQATTYWHLAGRRAYEGSSYVEAISHLNSGLEALKRLPQSLQQDQHAIQLQATLGAAYSASKGYAAPEVERAYGQARELCQQVGDDRQLFSVLVGLWNYHFVRGELHTAYDIGEQLLRMATQDQNPMCQLRAHAALGEILFHMGQLELAYTQLKAGIALYSAPSRHSYAVRAPMVACLAYAAWTMWHLGFPERARQHSHDALLLARDLAHPLSLSIALHFTATVHQFRREALLAHEHAAEAVTLSREQAFPFWDASGTIVLGWAQAMLGQLTAGIDQGQQGLAAFKATGAQVQLPSWMALLAEAHGRADQPAEGLHVLEEALAILHQTDERYYEAELHRLKGELLWQVDPTGHQEEAIACFRQALAVAARQGAKSWELRATASLSRLWLARGKRHEARELLAPVCGWFTEGFDTADLQEAKTLLEKLA